ncbi:MAG: hypothetical protein K2L82_04290 [Lachnospiraceae bacterium]|nr:hypothetical protein [Lachnospiraceae bacterium]
MVQIQLQALAMCNLDLNTPPTNLTFYQNIYVESGTRIDSNSAMMAYSVANDVDAEALKMVLNEMEAQGLNSLVSPIKRGGSYLFHISRGNRRKKRESASLFFRIYALTQAELTKLQNGQQAEAVEVIHIYTNTPMRAKVKVTEHSIIDGVAVDQSNFTIKIGDTDYQLIFDVVGIGYHLSDSDNNKYRMVYYNDNVLSQRDIDLAQQEL